MKYLGKKFTVPLGGKAFADNWETTFGDNDSVLKPDETQDGLGTKEWPSKCEKCGRSIDDVNINWNAPRDPLCVVCAYPPKTKGQDPVKDPSPVCEDCGSGGTCYGTRCY